MMFSESRIGAGAAADRESAQEPGIGDKSAEIGDGTAKIVDIAANVIPC